MRTIQVLTRADEDGVIRLTIPDGDPGGEYQVKVILQPTTEPPQKTPEELGWPPGFFEHTCGSITDEAFQRGDQGRFERRESF